MMLPTQLANELEKYRLDAPEAVTDRGVHYERHYAIGGGQPWSNSFTRSSKRVLGWSRGAHGLRHTYAQRRLKTLQNLGYLYDDALTIVSQEMGHFRAEITKAYLR